MQTIHKRYIENYSMLNKNMIIHGDARVSKKLVKLTYNHIKQNIDLYDAQDKIKDIIIAENGEDYYNKYASTINFINKPLLFYLRKPTTLGWWDEHRKFVTNQP